MASRKLTGFGKAIIALLLVVPGAIVAEMSVQQIKSLFDVSMLILGTMVQRTSETWRQSDGEMMNQLVLSLSEQVRAGDIEQFYDQVFIFLNRKSSSDWIHTGLGFDMKDGVFQTIEGNTNNDGSRNGYEVCQRTRTVKGKDFVVLS